MQICTQWTKWLNHTARKTKPGTGSSDCRRPLPSVTKPRASNWNHIILMLRHHSAVQIYKPIFNPRDIPTLRSFPSCSDTSDWSHLQLCRQNSLLLLAERHGMTSNSGSPNAHLQGFIPWAKAGKKKKGQVKRKHLLQLETFNDWTITQIPSFKYNAT